MIIFTATRSDFMRRSSFLYKLKTDVITKLRDKQDREAESSNERTKL